MIINKIASKQYRKFSSAEGSQYICSEYALSRVLKIIKIFRPERILEVGLGIGTISDSILKAFSNNYYPEVYGTERNDFCLNQLPKNIGKDFKKLKVYHSMQEIPEDICFDLIIIDGKESDLKSLQKNLKNNAIIIIEGDRKDQTQLLKNIFSGSKFVHSITSKKNNSYSNRSSDHFQGGLKIIFVNPNLKQNLYWVILKISAKIHFQFRKLV
ncbi:SAM-dependent methyltransferase [Christiangramia forsetii]|uniref:Class I SAM-dependent methyltransferase n=2 Tax=Christiangramia forsetii TaxID=411153 RepID=A0LYV8_CHRFK|nr:SAM-dependent methyltransferase [Christiangramia forsetii]GGG33241.1 hypothetical protein GCM10011532_16090 [Christiangramia forsetii]CAL65553.1 conserved hypothetical protein-possible methyltransferase [Christiangramia forsetii KT0803]